MELDELTGLPGTRLSPATEADAAELLVLQRCCWLQEALLNDTLEIPALHESLDDVREWTTSWRAWVVRQGPRLVGAVRGRVNGGEPDPGQPTAEARDEQAGPARDEAGSEWEVGRLMVAPDLAGRGLGRFLLAHVESQAPADARRFVLFTGSKSTRNITMYERAGYRLVDQPGPAAGHIEHAVYLVKDRG